jgi:CelD/BcsL family acetyltransferase involved in cellulose biosynthesis
MSDYRVEVETDPGRLRALVPEWEKLAARAAEPNVFFEPWMLLPALAHLAADAKVQIALVRDGAGELAGLFPLETRAHYKKLPLRQLRLWQYKHCYLCTPLIADGHVPAVIDAFYAWASRAPGLPRILVWNWISGDGPVFRALVAESDGRAARAPTERFVRSVLVRKPGTTGDSHIESVLSSSHRKDMRRLEKRLAEQGAFTYDRCSSPEQLETWIEEFLEIETRGWKGRQGTALLCNEPDRLYFTECVRFAFAHGKLRTLEARLDGKAIASRCNFIAGSTAFSFKIAFDEAFSKSRPGLLLELEHIRDFYGDSPQAIALERVDYCADAGHPMLDRLSEERKAVVSIALGTRPLENQLVRAIQGAEQLARKLLELRARIRDRKPRVTTAETTPGSGGFSS